MSEKDHGPGFFGYAFDFDHDGKLNTAEWASDLGQFMDAFGNDLLKQKQRERGMVFDEDIDRDSDEYDRDLDPFADFYEESDFRLPPYSVSGFTVSNPRNEPVPARPVRTAEASPSASEKEKKPAVKERQAEEKKIGKVMVPVLAAVIVILLFIAVMWTGMSNMVTGPLHWEQITGNSRYTAYCMAGLTLRIPSSFSLRNYGQNVNRDILFEKEYSVNTEKEHATVLVEVKRDKGEPQSDSELQEKARSQQEYGSFPEPYHQVDVPGASFAYRYIMTRTGKFDGDPGYIWGEQVACLDGLAVVVSVYGTRWFLETDTIDRILTSVDYSGFSRAEPAERKGTGKNNGNGSSGAAVKADEEDFDYDEYYDDYMDYDEDEDGHLSEEEFWDAWDEEDDERLDDYDDEDMR